MPSNTIPVKWLQDKNGNEFYPVTHKGAIRDDSGNPISVPEELNDLSDVTITPIIDNTQTYFENAVQDYDGNWYDAVIIGDQVWMAENLRTTHYTNGTAITYGNTNYSSSVGYYYYPNDDSTNTAQYGLLYNWPAIMNGASASNTNPSGVQGIAPTGWHVPSNSEFVQLKEYISANSQYWYSSNSSYIGKSLASQTGWQTSTTNYAVGNNQTENNSSLFSAYPAGQYDADMEGSRYFSQRAYIGTTYLNNNDLVVCGYLAYTSYSFYTNGMVVQTNGVSVRCLYNGTVQQFRQAMATKPSTDQILKYDGNHWVNTEIDHDFTFDSEIVSTSSATVTFSASQRGTHFIAAEDDLSITFGVNNESDNYLWIRNTGDSAIQIYISDMFHNGSRVQNIYMPEDDIIIQPGYAGEIGIVCNSVGAFITTRCDLRYTNNSPSV